MHIKDIKRNAFVGQAITILSRAQSSGEELDLNTLVDRILTQRPPSFFIGLEYACTVLKRMPEPTQEAPNPEELKTCMWRDLQLNVLRVQSLRKCTFRQAVEFVLNYVRPQRWYISRLQGRRLLRNSLKQSRIVVSLVKASKGA